MTEQVSRLTPLLPPAVEALWISYMTPGAVYVLWRLGGATTTNLSAQQALEALAAEGWDAAMTKIPGALNWNRALIAAAGEGRESTMRLCQSRGAGNWGAPLPVGAEKEVAPPSGIGGDTYWDRALAAAARGGHEGAMRLCGINGATAWSWGLVKAAGGGHTQVMLLCTSKGAKGAYCWESAMIEAARNGKKEAMLLCAEKSWKQLESWDLALAWAVFGNHPEAIRLCEAKGASNWNFALLRAAESGHKESMALCESKGATNWDGALGWAARGGHVDAMLLCESKGATSWDLALGWARDGPATELCLEKIRHRARKSPENSGPR